MNNNMDRSPKVVVVMSTYNGEMYLEEQLESLAGQKHDNLCVFVRDDGSKDKTQQILQRWSNDTNGWLTWYQGENLGPGRSFMDALKKAPEGDYYAFCDQDDVWDSDKVEVAVFKLEESSKEYKIYTSNAQLSSDGKDNIGITHFRANTTIQAALMYNQAVGCTIVMNKGLRNKLADYDPEYMIMHDCWAYRVCAALGGELCFDMDSHIKYRQHGGNFSGGGQSEKEVWLRRVKSLFGRKKHMRKWTAEELLKGYGNDIPDSCRTVVENFAYYNSSIKSKWRLLRDKEIYSNSKRGNLGIVAAIILGML